MSNYCFTNTINNSKYNALKEKYLDNLKNIAEKSKFININTLKEKFMSANVENHQPLSKEPGVIVIHQCVGSLPPFKAEAFCERVKDQFTKGKEWLEFKKKFPNWNFVLLPTRTAESHVEVFHGDEKERKEVIGEIARITTQHEQPIQDTPELKKRAQDYVLCMLGAPVVHVELTQDQLDFCYKHSLDAIHDYHARVRKFSFTESYRAQSEEFLIQGVLAHAKVILGNIRRSLGVPQDGRTHLDPNDLYVEGKKDLAKWKNYLAHVEEVDEEENA